MKILNNKINLGFTLVELLVSMAIFCLLAAATIANFRQAQKSNALRHDSLALAENIRKVQNLGMSGQIFEDTVPEGGYGIAFKTIENENTNYVIFADNGDQIYTTEDQILSQGTIILSDNVQFADVKSEGTLAFCMDCYVVITFKPPRPTPFFYAGEKKEEEPVIVERDKPLDILLKHVGINQCRLIVINGVSGQVDETVFNDKDKCDAGSFSPSPTF